MRERADEGGRERDRKGNGREKEEIDPEGEARETTGGRGGGVCRGGIVQSKLFERSRARAITPPAITTPCTKRVGERRERT